ncbi:MAG: SOUL heme-binding protein [Methylomonas sp.]|nr:MAG: SOUL heme-binding protein [Methylomonas sp.]
MAIFFISSAILLFIAAAAWSIIGSRGEQPKYVLVSKHDDMEIRDYDPMIVAEVEVSGERVLAINDGFRLLAGYIFGGNTPQHKLAMTAPVTQQASEKIAMTAPVTQQGGDSGKWVIHFVMPSQYSLATLPKPDNSAVELKAVPSKRYAVIRFSGIAGEQRIQEKQVALEIFLKQQGLEAIAKPVYAFFNPPWTLPFMRRNEVMIEIAKP